MTKKGGKTGLRQPLERASQNDRFATGSDRRAARALYDLWPLADGNFRFAVIHPVRKENFRLRAVMVLRAALGPRVPDGQPYRAPGVQR